MTTKLSEHIEILLLGSGMGKQLILMLTLRYQAENNGSSQDFNEKQRKEQQKLEEIKVHIQQSLFLHMNVKQISLTPRNITRHLP